MLLPLLRLLDDRKGEMALAPHGDLLPNLFGHPITVELWAVLVGFSALATCSAVLSRYKSIYLSELLYETLNKMRVDLFAAIANARWSAVSRMRQADLNHVLTGDLSRVQLLSFNLFSLANDVILLVGFSAIAAFVSLSMTVFAVVSGLCVFFALQPLRRYAHRFGETLTRERQAQNQTISDFLQGLKVAKSYNAEQSYVARLETLLTRLRLETMRFLRITSLSGTAFQSLITIFGCIFIYIAHAFFKLEFAKIILLLIVFTRIAPRFNDVQTQYQELIVNLPAYAVMQATFDECTRAAEPVNDLKSPKPLPFTRTLSFENISYDYGHGPVFKDLSFALEARSVTALVGPSGVGKSTIADLVMGLLAPTSGRILIDGVALEAGDLRQWRGHISYVPQDSFLLSASVADNLRIAAPDASTERLRSALSQAQALSFVDGLPQGLETLVGEGGIALSGGERQRISLARALLRDPELLILDEVTSALDGENARRITETIVGLKSRLTVLIITHDPEVARSADKTIELLKAQ